MTSCLTLVGIHDTFSCNMEVAIHAINIICVVLHVYVYMYVVCTCYEDILHVYML